MKELDRFTSERLEILCDYRPNRVTNLINFREIAALAQIALAAKRAEPVAWTSQRSLETKNKIVAFTDDMSALDYGAANGGSISLNSTPPHS
ncbi:hypothetical protein [Yersinia enterocolitica]